MAPLCAAVLLLVPVVLSACDEDCARRRTCVVPSGAGGGGGGTSAVGGANAADGELCDDAMHCSSGFCAQGVCCDAACDRECDTCAAADKEGLCGVVPTGDDPHDGCAGAAVCGSEGSCDYADHVYSTSFGDADYQRANALATDSLGNLHIVGGHAGTFNFGGELLGPADGVDGFVAKFAANGQLSWTHELSGPTISSATQVGIDAFQRVHVLGGLFGVHDFGGGDVYGNQLAGADLFVLHLTSAGIYQDAVGFEVFPQSSGKAGAVFANPALTNDGGIVLGGTIQYNSGASINGIPYQSTGPQAIAFKLLNGAVTWVRYLGGASYGASFIHTTSATDDGGVLIAGGYTGNVSVGALTLSSPTSAGAFIARLDANGSPSWATTLESPSLARIKGMAQLDGDIVVVGEYQGTLSAAGGTLTATSQGGDDAFVAKLNVGGVVTDLWSYGTAGADELTSVAVDAAGNLLLGGHTTGTINFGGDNLTSAGGQDIVVAKFTPAGEHLWSRIFGGMDEGIYADALAGVAVGADDTTILAGTIGSSFSFGGSTLTHQGKGDVFLAILGP